MRIAVVGSRTFTDSALLAATLSEYTPTVIVSGGAQGADQMAADWANANKITLTEFYPDYDTYGRAAPIKRIYLIVDAADILIAFWDGKSKGTKYTIDYAERSNKFVRLIMF